MYKIYCILNKINNKRYIWVTNDIKKRKIAHFWALNNNTHINNELQTDFIEHWKNNFEFQIIKYVKIWENKYETERDTMLSYWKENIYNKIIKNGEYKTKYEKIEQLDCSWIIITEIFNWIAKDYIYN